MSWLLFRRVQSSVAWLKEKQEKVIYSWSPCLTPSLSLDSLRSPRIISLFFFLLYSHLNNSNFLVSFFSIVILDKVIRDQDSCYGHQDWDQSQLQKEETFRRGEVKFIISHFCSCVAPSSLFYSASDPTVLLQSSFDVMIQLIPIWVCTSLPPPRISVESLLNYCSKINAKGWREGTLTLMQSTTESSVSASMVLMFRSCLDWTQGVGSNINYSTLTDPIIIFRMDHRMGKRATNRSGWSRDKI